MRKIASLLSLGVLSTGLALPGAARADATAIAVQKLGAPAVAIFSRAPRTFALVRVPAEVDPVSLGLRSVLPGIGVFEGTPSEVAGFAIAHPTLGLELKPPLRTKLDVAVKMIEASPAQLAGTAPGGGALDGAGTFVAIVDTGLDITHPDFRNADGTTRVAWFLDYAQKPRAGNDLDQKYGGLVMDRAAIDAILKGSGTMPPHEGDGDGHGTHVAGIAAGNGGTTHRYVGVAPGADIIVVRASDDQGNVDEGKAILGVQFAFDRAKEAGKPASVNLSLGTQFGAHDGTSTFETALVGLTQGPGRAISVAASNEGHLPIHTSVRVSPGATYHIPVRLHGVDGKGTPYSSGQVFVWLNFRDHGNVKVGVRKFDGSTWIDPVPQGSATQQDDSGMRAIVANEDGKNVPNTTSGAIVAVTGPLAVGDFGIDLEGDGAVEMWLQGADQAIDGPGMPTFPQGGQIEGTIGVPASAAGLLAIGCVTSRTSYTTTVGKTVVVEDGSIVGTRCYFSSAGPSADGTFRPDVLAPGQFIVSALAHAAHDAAGLGGEFDNSQIVDPQHGALEGTSMSTPFGTGAAALLFQKDPKLTIEDVRAAFSAGAKPLIDDPVGYGTPRDYAKGAGVLSVAGAVAALDRKGKAPAATTLSLRLGADYLAADGKLPVWGVAVAHDAEGRPADIEGLALEADGASVYQPLSHPAPGVYRFAVVASKSSGGSTATVRLNGPLSITRQLPVGSDKWDARDGVRAAGGCSGCGVAHEHGARAGLSALAIVALTFLRRSRSRSRAAAPVCRPGATGASDRRC